MTEGIAFSTGFFTASLLRERFFVRLMIDIESSSNSFSADFICFCMKREKCDYRIWKKYEANATDIAMNDK